MPDSAFLRLIERFQTGSDIAEHCLRPFVELVLALGAGDVLFTAAALEAQARFALRAAEILVGLYAPEPQEKLADFRLRVSRLVHELAISSCRLATLRLSIRHRAYT